MTHFTAHKSLEPPNYVNESIPVLLEGHPLTCDCNISIFNQTVVSRLLTAIRHVINMFVMVSMCWNADLFLATNKRCCNCCQISRVDNANAVWLNLQDRFIFFWFSVLKQCWQTVHETVTGRCAHSSCLYWMWKRFIPSCDSKKCVLKFKLKLIRSFSSEINKSS